MVDNALCNYIQLKDGELYNSGRAWASPEYKSNIRQFRCTYVCMYLSIYLCSDTSSTCLSRMRKFSDGKDRHDAAIVQYAYGTVEYLWV